MSSRHAEAARATLRLSVADDDLVLEVADDGHGGGADGAPGIGQRSMVERAEELGGLGGGDGRCAPRNAGPRPAAVARRPMPEPLRVLVADDHPVYRDGIRTLLASLDGVELVGEARTARRRSACPRARAGPGPDGPRHARATGSRRPGRSRSTPGTGVLVLTMFEDDDSVFSAMRAGARGYLLKDADREELARAIDTIGHGGAIFGAGVARRVQSFFTRRPAGTSVPRPHRQGTGGARPDRPRGGEPDDRPSPWDQPEDGPQPREHDPRQADGRRPLAGHRPRQGGRARRRAGVATRYSGLIRPAALTDGRARAEGHEEPRPRPAATLRAAHSSSSPGCSSAAWWSSSSSSASTSSRRWARASCTGTSPTPTAG